MEEIPRETILANIQGEFRRLEGRRPANPPPTDSPEYAATLDRTIADLNERVAEERAALEQLKASHHATTALDGPSADESTQLQHLRSLTAAYSALASERPYLPARPSALPYLLAHRTASRAVADGAAAAAPALAALSSARARLAAESADLADNAVLAEALRARLAALRSTPSRGRPPNPEQAARRVAEAAATQGKAHAKQARALTRALARFIEADLGAKLAAEELGGPVAGSAPAAGEQELRGGFAPSGRPRKGPGVAEDKRQRRIDEIWGEAGDGFEGEDRSESEAAAAEMTDLVEALLNAAAEEGPAQYVELKRDSASARFLVRANVALLHRSDARKIRLMEFGREIDD